MRGAPEACVWTLRSVPCSALLLVSCRARRSLRATRHALCRTLSRSPQEQKFFDSADWALKKEAAAKQQTGDQPPPPPPEEQLKPKLEPTPIPARRISHLESMEK